MTRRSISDVREGGDAYGQIIALLEQIEINTRK